MKKETIIVIEDNDTMRLGIVESLAKEGFIMRSFDNGPEAIEDFKINKADLAIIDLKMDPMDGLTLLNELKKMYENIEVLMISAYGTVQDAVDAMKKGASDFLTKPFSPDELRIRINRIIEKLNKSRQIEELIEHNKLLSEEIQTDYSDFIGESEAMKEILELVKQVAENKSTVLITGESGTGKELVARELHRCSSRSEKPFIKLNCGALNENLLESELFGHEKGSFTGAVKRKRGRFELADKGTLFLDEIGDISLAMQVKLLRVLQEGEFERVGGEETIKTDVRLIAATNKDLHKMIREEKFREDLFYRLSIIPLNIPTLRERKIDIPLLVEHFLNKVAVKNKSVKKNINAEGIELLQKYNWPGNIRELENLVERLSVISTEDIIDTGMIIRHLSGNTTTGNDFTDLPLEQAVYNYEKNIVEQAMKKSDGIKNRAAKLLGIKTSVLYYKLEKFGLIK